ncbi:hypothetical protein AALA00_12175 [Lachnospiraceae bacterium 46-15]
MSGRRNPEKPDAWQKQIICKAGLEPWKWLVVKENPMYLYLVDRGVEQRENIIIDKDTYEVMRPKRRPPHR